MPIGRVRNAGKNMAKVIAFYIPGSFRKKAIWIPPGQRGKVIEVGYKVEGESSGSNVEVSIVQGENVVAKELGHLVQLNAPAPYNAAVTLKKDGRTSSLVEVRFEGRNASLELT